jgi:miniconductance mechanosensitive channel
VLNIIIDSLLSKISTKPVIINFLDKLVILFAITLIATFVYYTSTIIIRKYIKQYLAKSHSIFLQIFAKQNGFNIIGHLFSALVFRLCSNFVILHNDMYEQYIANIINKLSMLYLFITIIIVVTKLIKIINPYYEANFEAAKKYPITAYINLILIIVWLLGGVFIITFFANISMTSVITGIGATSAIFLLIFRDPLLGVVSSIQAAASNIVKVGDRICIDKYNLDGIITNISITTVKIQNSDNTMVTIPTYYLTSEAVKNWRTMHESGVRRIKKSILINANSIHELTTDVITSLKTDNYINMENIAINNLALYRAFIEAYLKSNQYISKDNVILVHYLDHQATGLPLEIYAYINNSNFVNYENIQSEIIEYCLLNAKKFAITIVQLT